MLCDKTCHKWSFDVVGLMCHTTCNGRGICDNGTCICDFNLGFKGEKCDIIGCPGWPDNCMNNGDCNQATQTCECNQGWKGNGCHIPDCDCSGVDAICEQRENDTKPRCYECAAPFIGDRCQYR